VIIGPKHVLATSGTVVLTVRNARETCPSRYFCKAAKIRAHVRAAYGRYPLIGDRPGQCLVSDGFETRIGRADKAKPIQTEKFAIHTLGHVPTFSTLKNIVGFPPETRHSPPNVQNPFVIGPSGAAG
jgi:hypothetical protein